MDVLRGTGPGFITNQPCGNIFGITETKEKHASRHRESAFFVDV